MILRWSRALALLIAVGILLGTLPALAQVAGDKKKKNSNSIPADLAHLDKALRSFVKRIRRSVVSVRAYEMRMIEDDSTDPGLTAVLNEVTVLRTSGMIRDRGGLVMTVLPEGIPFGENGVKTRVEISLFDGTILPAHWEWDDRETGVTLLRMDGELPKLHPVRFPFKKLEKNNLVVALGRIPDSFSLGPVLSLYVAARGDDFSFPRTIHAAVAVRSGDAGGMLADVYGRVVGMLAYAPSASFSLPPDQTSQAFAIPVDLLEHICRELIEKGRVTRGSIGAVCRFVPRDVMQPRGHTGVGAHVLQIDPAGSGAQGGLMRGDLILAVNNEHFWDMEDLYAFREQIEYGEIGSQLHLKVFRSTKRYTGFRMLHVELAERVEFSVATVGIRKAEDSDTEGRDEEIPERPREDE